MANRFRFAAIALATALPIVIFAVVVTAIFFRQEKRAIEQALMQAAGNAVQLVDSRIVSGISALQMVQGLVASVPRSTAPLQFQIAALPALQQHPEWLALVLSNADGSEWLVEARRGTQGFVIDRAPRRGLLADTLPSVRDGEPSAVVSDVLTAEGFEEPFVILRVPVTDGDGAVIYHLSAVVRAWHFTDALKGQHLPNTWFATLLDGDRRIIARSRAEDATDGLIGRAANASMQAAADRPRTVLPLTTIEGIDARAVVRRSQMTDWTVVVGAPAAALERLQQGTVLAIALGALVTGATALVVLVATGRIASRQEQEERQRESDRRVAHIAAQFPGVMYRRVLHPDGRISYPYVSQGLERLVGFAGDAVSEPMPLEAFAQKYIHPDDRRRWREAILKSAAFLSPYDEEGRLIDAQGEVCWVRTAARPHREPNGAVVWDGFILDITELKATEQRLRRSLDEKVTLLREIHHRVKNNLQAVWGMLQIEANRLKDIPEARERLDVLGQRIAVLGRIHEQLYASDLLTQVEMAAQVRQLCERLQDLTEGQRVRFVLDLEPLACDIDTAIPLSLGVNEVVSNALKHGFPGDRTGTIQVVLRREGGEVLLLVEDDGVGARPEALDAGRGIGMMLIRALAAQIEASVDYDCRAGCRVRLRIPGDRFRSPGEEAS